MQQDNNPYQSPQADVADALSLDNLAGRGERLGAAIIDGLIMLAVMLPIMWIGGYFSQVMVAAASGEQPSFVSQLMWVVIGFAVFVAVQYYPLNATAQTWGKRLVGVRIANLDGSQPGIGQLIGKRYLPVQVVSSLPFVGWLIGLVNVLLIFREDRRCGHDLVAGTKVVKAN
ncbi:RDD family protein [Marilutibacter alkalisoli]|uniref:RDD family protein n=1 Tax=Marilutibacter alkalisoli TaxID=2591633 RepID=A0A514BQW9_9GAMM|nr:RDD family protein [Lysobacter alkalisoli]QDH69793.1 RDD family protein [Lysobacter alkalisoli]